jgi:hypothetical protein
MTIPAGGYPVFQDERLNQVLALIYPARACFALGANAYDRKTPRDITSEALGSPARAIAAHTGARE